MTGQSETIKCLEVSDPDRLVRNPLVSVVMITYNHEHFIQQAIEGVVGQQTEFGVELIIGEDCSPDNTRQIALEYQRKYPEKIRVLISEKNIGAHENFLSVYAAARGQYIALCEGDDYWVSKNKLQKQVEVFETNEDVSLCFHDQVAFNNSNGTQVKFLTRPDNRNRYSLEDLVLRNFIPNASSMHKKLDLNGYRKLLSGCNLGDWFLHVLSAERGHVQYVEGLLSAYRVHDDGCWSSLTSIKRYSFTIRAYQNINEYTKFTYKKKINSMICKYYYRMATAYMASNDYNGARNVAIQILKYVRYDKYVKCIGYVSKKKYLKAILKPFVFPVYNHFKS